MAESTLGIIGRAWRVRLMTTAAALCLLLGVLAGAALRPSPAATPMIAVHRAARHARPAAPKPFEFPAGGRTLAGRYRFIALYGSPDSPVLGALGEQPPEAATARIKTIVDAYRPYTAEPLYPTFEIITTVASASPTENNDYSRELDSAQLLPWIDAAAANGVYVVLDLQPGRTDFLTQAQRYQTLLARPNVGLALDPEWRLTASQVPLRQIGSVDIAEVNATAAWLAALTAQNKLPQKLLVLHQFRLDMIPGRAQLDTAHPELAYVVQMDGQGTQPQKWDTWRTITAAPPPGVVFGWKNFYRQDTPMLGPQDTMLLNPKPWYVSYQ